MKKKNRFDLFLSFLSLFLVTVFCGYIWKTGNVSFDVNIFLFFVNAIFSTFCLNMDKKLISLNKMNWYFVLIFLCIAPLCNYVSGYFPWNYYVEKKYVMLASICVFIWNIVFFITWFFFSGKREKAKQTHYVITSASQYILFFSSIVCFFLVIKNTGLSGLFSKSTYHISEGTFSIAFDFLLKFTPVISFILIYSSRNKISFRKIILSVLAAIILLIDNPIGNSRFNTAAIGLSLLALFLLKTHFNGKVLDFIIILIIVLLYPLMYNLRYYSLNTISNYQYSIDIVGGFNSVDFDAFSLLARSIEYKSNNGVLFGKQILNTIFFFVPRNVLPIKGVNSGRLIVESQAFGSYGNVSCPIMAEGILDFGVLGLILYSFACSWLFSKCDRKIVLKYNSMFFLTFYILTYGFVIYLFRGALAPTWLRFMGALLPLLLLIVVDFLFKDSTKKIVRINLRGK